MLGSRRFTDLSMGQADRVIWLIGVIGLANGDDRGLTWLGFGGYDGIGRDSRRNGYDRINNQSSLSIGQDLMYNTLESLHLLSRRLRSFCSNFQIVVTTS